MGNTPTRERAGRKGLDGRRRSQKLKRFEEDEEDEEEAIDMIPIRRKKAPGLERRERFITRDQPRIKLGGRKRIFESSPDLSSGSSASEIVVRRKGHRGLFEEEKPKRRKHKITEHDIDVVIKAIPKNASAMRRGYTKKRWAIVYSKKERYWVDEGRKLSEPEVVYFLMNYPEKTFYVKTSQFVADVREFIVKVIDHHLDQGKKVTPNIIARYVVSNFMKNFGKRYSGKVTDVTSD